ncbi:MAG: O-antigen ligase family protein [Planctomycetota bacterium]|nr:O-antigen ligase family protein [Planctomycetota bacterium]
MFETLQFLFFAVWALLVPIPNSALYSEDLRLLLYNYRPHAIAGAVFAFGLAYYALSRFWNRPAPPANRLVHPVLQLAFVFPFYFLLLQATRVDTEPAMAVFYFLWAGCSFYVAQNYSASRERLKRMCLLLAAAFALNLLVCWALAVQQGKLAPILKDRISIGYENPHFAAMVGQGLVITCLAWFLARQASGGARDLRVYLLVGVCVAGSVLLAYLARARGTLGFYIAAAVFFWILRRSERSKLFLPLLAYTVLASVAFTAFLEREQVGRLDTIASGRLSFWSLYVDYLTEKENPILEGVFGFQEVPQSTLGSYDSLGKQKRFSTLHFDNIYLEMMVKGGAVGVLFFFGPYLLILYLGLNNLHLAGKNRNLAAWLLAVLLATLVHGSVVTTMPTFNNPVGFLTALLSISSIGIVHEGMRERARE